MICKIDGCEKPVHYKSRGICQMHYFRYMRNGTYEKNNGEPYKYRASNPKGYQMIKIPGHPLAHKSGYVYEHRKIMHDVYGDTLPPCRLCGKDIDWNTCHIDHIDQDVTNNAKENLRPLCRPCNTNRDRDYTKSKNCNLIYFMGETNSVAGWARDPRIKVKEYIIRQRLRAGWSVEDAMTKPVAPRSRAKKMAKDKQGAW